jgi:hypothetical protein
MNDPEVTCGGPDGRRLLAFALQVGAAARGALAALAARIATR